MIYRIIEINQYKNVSPKSKKRCLFGFWAFFANDYIMLHNLIINMLISGDFLLYIIKSLSKLNQALTCYCKGEAPRPCHL